MRPKGYSACPRRRWYGPRSPSAIPKRRPVAHAPATDPRANPSTRSSTKNATVRRTMNDSFDTETLGLLDETEEVRIETRRDEDSPEHRTIVWVVVTGGEVF